MKKLLLSIIGMLIVSSNTIAMNLNSYVNQGAKVINLTSNLILATDPAIADFNNKSIEKDYQLDILYASVRFTSIMGQTFSHTINIYSGVDYSPICSNSSNLKMSFQSEEQNKPVTSNPTRCEVSSYISIDKEYGKVFGFQIIVKDA